MRIRESVCERVWVIFCCFIFECCLEWITGKPAMVKAGGVGEKGRALCSCCLDPAWHENGSSLPAPEISEMRGFWKGSQQAPLRWIKWDSSLQSKSFKKGGWWFPIVCSSHCLLGAKITVLKLLIDWVAMCTLNNVGIGMRSLILNDLSRNHWWRFYKLCEAYFLFGNHLLICSDQYFYKNLHLPRMALEAEPPLRPISLLWLRWPGNPGQAFSVGSSQTGRPGEVQSHPSSGHLSW